MGKEKTKVKYISIERLQGFIEFEKISYKEFSKKTGLSRGTFYNIIENEHFNLTLESIATIMNAYHLDINEIISIKFEKST